MIKEFQGEYRWLSNFAPCKIIYNQVYYHSVEAAYMSAKSVDADWKVFCANHRNTAGQIKKASRNVQLVDNWEDIKLSVMEECIRQKFNQEPYKSQLIATGDEYIQEGNNWNDKFWGFCLKTNKGQNNLGKLIMKIRDDLIEEIKAQEYDLKMEFLYK